MCGRYTLTAPEGLSERFDVREAGPGEARYNIAPAQLVTAILGQAGHRTARRLRWGFRPSWAREESSHPAPINARAETLLDRPLFRDALTTGRCLIPADGFYEWQVTPSGARQPVYIRRRDGGLFAFAGLCATTRAEGQAGGATCAIVTCTPNALVAPVHGRMPAILTPEAEDLWLDANQTSDLALALVRPYPTELLEAYKVPPLVNDARREDAALIRPLAAA